MPVAAVIQIRPAPVQVVATPYGTLRTRPQTDADETFLVQLFETVKGPEMALLPAEVRENLLRMQYRAMTGAYRTSFPDASFEIVLLDDRPVGRLIRDAAEDRLHIVYIAFMPEWRHRGVGSALMRAVMAEAARFQRGCEAIVALDNVASLGLWSKLGFSERARDGANVIVDWQSPVTRA